MPLQQAPFFGQGCAGSRSRLCLGSWPMLSQPQDPVTALALAQPHPLVLLPDTTSCLPMNPFHLPSHAPCLCWVPAGLHADPRIGAVTAWDWGPGQNGNLLSPCPCPRNWHLPQGRAGNGSHFCPRLWPHAVICLLSCPFPSHPIPFAWLNVEQSHLGVPVTCCRGGGRC